MLSPTSLEINASVTESRYTIKSYYYTKPNEQEVIKVMCNIIALPCLVCKTTFRVAVFFDYFIVSSNTMWQQKGLLVMMMIKWLYKKVHAHDLCS